MLLVASQVHSQVTTTCSRKRTSWKQQKMSEDQRGGTNVCMYCMYAYVHRMKGGGRGRGGLAVREQAESCANLN